MENPEKSELVVLEEELTLLDLQGGAAAALFEDSDDHGAVCFSGGGHSLQSTDVDNAIAKHIIRKKILSVLSLYFHGWIAMFYYNIIIKNLVKNTSFPVMLDLTILILVFEISPIICYGYSLEVNSLMIGQIQLTNGSFDEYDPLMFEKFILSLKKRIGRRRPRVRTNG